MTKYIVTHWRGQQSLLKATLINGVGGYLVLVCLLVLLGQFIVSRWFVYAGLVVFLAWWIWASVGICRGATKAVFGGETTTWLKSSAVVALLGVLGATYFLVRDLIHLAGFQL
jgi:hypothetical protein